MKAVDRETFQEALERVGRAAARFAGKSGFLLQPDPAQRRYVLEGLARNLLEQGLFALAFTEQPGFWVGARDMGSVTTLFPMKVDGRVAGVGLRT